MGAAPGTRVVPVLIGLFAFFTPFSIAGAHTSLALALAAALAFPDSRRRLLEFRRHPLALPVAAWMLVSILAVVFALEPGRSVEKLKKLALLPLLPLGALPSVRRAIRPIVPVLLAATAIVSVVGLVQFFAAGGGLDARLRGISGFYMTVGGILMMVGLLCLAELLAALKDPNPRRVAFLVGCGVVILVALAGTYTRGSWIGFAAGAVYLLRRRWSVLALLAIAVAALVFLGSAESRDRVMSIFDPGHARNVERVLIWEHGLGLLGERPLTGVGLVIPDELMDKEVMTERGPIRVHSHMHNTYLQIAVSMGIPALVVFGWLMVAFFRMGRRAERAVLWNLWEQGLVAAFPACLLALLVNGLFEWNFGDSEILGLFYCLAGLTLGVESSPED